MVRERVEGKGPRRVACSSRRRPEQSRGGSQVQSVCERERRERRERGQQRMGHPRLNQRERDGNEASGRTAAAEDGANHAEGGQAPTAAQANPGGGGGGVLCRGDEIDETACTKSTKITTGLRSKFSEYMKST